MYIIYIYIYSKKFIGMVPPKTWPSPIENQFLAQVGSALRSQKKPILAVSIPIFVSKLEGKIIVAENYIYLIYPISWFYHYTILMKTIRCNLGLCPELMSRNQRIAHRGWLILIPHEDKVDVISPINISFWGGGESWSLMKIKLMLLARSVYWS